ncbi:DNA-3-methyladenine glycosylase 2 family protein [Alcaligenaceae bacterium]|nr:DNA-3-methyladenine glycosylase 2 family protein [Alcaligenaceae bacterium]
MKTNEERLISETVLARHLESLLQLDPRLKNIHNIAGPFSLRSRAPGFAGLARIVCGQQLSVASADAIWGRLASRLGTVTAEAFLALEAGDLQGLGLSRGKYATLAGVAQAEFAGELDFAVIAGLPAEAAIAGLTRYKGIGPWTAEIYLMFCAGHPDIFPVGDLALRNAVADAFDIEPCPTPRALARIASEWAPYRATAALMFWRFYAARRHRQGLPV